MADMTKPYTYDDAIRDAPKHVKLRIDKPTEPGWYPCLDADGDYSMRWWMGGDFSVHCTQEDADAGDLNDFSRLYPVGIVIGWCEPWWGR